MQKTGMENQSKVFGAAAFDVEHALGLYAISYCVLPAESIYNRKLLAPMMSVIDTCHIYLIGYTPKIDLFLAEQRGNFLDLSFRVLGKEHVISYELPPSCVLKKDAQLMYLEDSTGQRFWPDELEMQRRLNAVTNEVNFEVKYIGQAYGKDGSRNAVDRLLKHETLQEISLRGVPEGYRLSLLLLAVQPNNQVITRMSPFAKNQNDGDARIKLGLDKLHNTSEIERISLYEAALIRYFYPEFNVEFKDSFPSTNLKILQDCYAKDFTLVIAEINFDDLPFRIWSKSIAPRLYHIAKFDLHKDEARRMFFGV